jgi:protein O-GlcNAc transferase
VAKLTINHVLKQAVDAHKAKQLHKAHHLYAAILKVQPKHPDANHNTGLLTVGFGKIELALPFFKTALEANPSNAQFWYSHIVALIKLEKLTDAKVLLDQAKSKGIKGADFDQLEQRLNDASKAPAIKPDYADSQHNMGVALQNQGNLEEAIEAYNKTLAIKPDHVLAYYNMANALQAQGNLKEAIEAYGKALAIKPDYADSYKNMANALQAQGDLKEAIKAYRKALAIKPDYADAHNNMGYALQAQGNLEEAIEAYCKALAINPDYALAYYNMADALQAQGNLKEAIEAYSKALAIKPDYVAACYNMANAFQAQGNLKEAIEAYNKALAIIPDYESRRAQKLYWQAKICDWNSIAKDLKLVPELGTNKKKVEPFFLLSLEDAPERHQTRSKIYAKAIYPQKILPPKDKPSKRPKRIRIGYFSTDFKEHPVAYLIAKVLEQHNRDQFEVCGYSINGPSSCAMRQRLEKSFDSFTDVQSMSDRDIALQVRQDEIDIIIDLNGYTQQLRTGIFAYRAAPIQINYLGYPGTMGSKFIDYIVADPILIPEGKRQYYSEQIIYLPNSYQPTDNTRTISGKVVTREDMGLPSVGFVFCCFNNNYKISPKEFDIWMRLMNKVEGSVLWLLKSNKWAEQNLKRQTEIRGVSAERIIFAERMPQAEHLARQRLADLFLDTFNYNAHTTASDALWAGLPLVTKLGKGFAARVAGSLLNAVGLPELITQN